MISPRRAGFSTKVAAVGPGARTAARPAPDPVSPNTQQHDDVTVPEDPDARDRPRRLVWAGLPKRARRVDALERPQCGGRMGLIAVILDPTVAWTMGPRRAAPLLAAPAEKALMRIAGERTPEQRESIGDRLVTAKKVAPTSPHPSAPDTPPGNIVTGLASAALDKTKDVAVGAARGVVDKIRGKKGSPKEK